MNDLFTNTVHQSRSNSMEENENRSPCACSHGLSWLRHEAQDVMLNSWRNEFVSFNPCI